MRPQEDIGSPGAVAEVSAIARSASFIRSYRSWRLLPSPRKILIGSEPACDWVLEGPNVLPRECLLRWDGQLLIASTLAGRDRREVILEPHEPLRLGPLEIVLTPLVPAASLPPDAPTPRPMPVAALPARAPLSPPSMVKPLAHGRSTPPPLPAMVKPLAQAQSATPSLPPLVKPLAQAQPAAGTQPALVKPLAAGSSAPQTLPPLVKPLAQAQSATPSPPPLVKPLAAGKLAPPVIAPAPRSPATAPAPAPRAMPAPAATPTTRRRDADEETRCERRLPAPPKRKTHAKSGGMVGAIPGARQSAASGEIAVGVPAAPPPTSERSVMIATDLSPPTRVKLRRPRWQRRALHAVLALPLLAFAADGDDVPRLPIVHLRALAPAAVPVAAPAPPVAAAAIVTGECQPLPAASHATAAEHARLQAAIEAYQGGRRAEADALFRSLACRPEVGPPARFMARLLVVNTPALLPYDRGARTRRLLEETERELEEHPDLWRQRESLAGAELINPALSPYDFKDQPKCNIFIAEMLYRAGFVAPGTPAPGRAHAGFPNVNQMVALAQRLQRGLPWDAGDGVQWFDVVARNAAEPGDLVLIAAKDRGDRDRFATEHGHVEIIRDIAYERGAVTTFATVGARSSGVKLSPGAGRIFGAELEGSYQFNELAVLVRPRMR